MRVKEQIHPSQNFSVTSRHIKPIITTLANSMRDKRNRWAGVKPRNRRWGPLGPAAYRASAGSSKRDDPSDRSRRLSNIPPSSSWSGWSAQFSLFRSPVNRPEIGRGRTDDQPLALVREQNHPAVGVQILQTASQPNAAVVDRH